MTDIEDYETIKKIAEELLICACSWEPNVKLLGNVTAKDIEYLCDYLIYNEKMTEEQQELLNYFQEELEKCFKIAQKLDALNPELPRAFTGTISERIERQLYTLGILND